MLSKLGTTESVKVEAPRERRRNRGGYYGGGGFRDNRGFGGYGGGYDRYCIQMLKGLIKSPL